MNVFDRLRERVKQEGILKSVKYIGCAGYDSTRSMVRDALFDFKYSGWLLDNRRSRYKHLGANDVYHSDYDALQLIFNYCCPVQDDDILVDVGCGKGRVINFWLSRGLSNRMVGLELDPDIAAQTAKQFARWPNVSICAGDAISNLPAAGTLFYFYNPFAKDKVCEFENRLLQIAPDKPVKVVYYNPKSIDVFNPKLWNIEHLNFEQDLGIQRWGRINKFHDLALIQRQQ